ncbi:hypothetical protein C8J57DRAFT_1251290 [Mycena rebaudengoi]|nr:hypothetical protein C8J57DRAFT_1251290 [Mycena rebaudengoi]
MCAIQAMGNFDAMKGGHLFLWELKLVIEFPAGATILLPSATFSHSNIPVQPGDKQGSFAQYTAGGLMHYVDNRFRMKKELAVQDPEEYRWTCELKVSRWEMGLGLLSTVDELLEGLVPGLMFWLGKLLAHTNHLFLILQVQLACLRRNNIWRDVCIVDASTVKKLGFVVGEGYTKYIIYRLGFYHFMPPGRKPLDPFIKVANQQAAIKHKLALPIAAKDRMQRAHLKPSMVVQKSATLASA